MIKKDKNAISKPKVRRQDFVCENGWFDNVHRLPGSLQMQQFQISDCQETNIYIFDANAGVYIDDCKYCRIYVGPSQSSIFVRDCSCVTVICCTKQFRVRDSTHCNFILWCQSQPIIQSSYALTFRCFPEYTYDNFLHQFKSAGLGTIWENNWFDIYDFTPRKFEGLNSGQPNYKCVFENERGCAEQQQNQTFIQKYTQKINTLNLELNKNLVPRCLSTRGVSFEDFVVLILSPVPLTSMGLHTLHSRVGMCPAALEEKYCVKEALFVKILPAWIGKWKKDFQSNLKGIIRDKDEKEMLECTVFIPFRDQH